MTKATRRLIDTSLQTVGINPYKKLRVKPLGYRVSTQFNVARYILPEPKQPTPQEISYKLARMNWYA